MSRVKSYEGKLATLTAINSALQSENGDLRRQLEEAAVPTTATGAAPAACATAGLVRHVDPDLPREPFAAHRAHASPSGGPFAGVV